MTEANKLEIPVVGTGDTNVDPDELDYIIPANDDAIRAIRLLCTLVADAAIEGASERSARSSTEPEQIEAMAMPEAEEEVPGATDELVAALAGGAALSFEPDADDDDLLPGDRVARAEAAVADAAAEATPEEIAAELAREAAEKAEDDRRLHRRPAEPAADPRRPIRRAHDTIARHARTGGPGRAAARTGATTGMADISAELVKDAARADRRRLHGLQERAGRGRRRPREGDRAPPREGPRRRGEEGRPRRPRGPRLELHPHRRPRRRPHRGQLRDRLRRPHRRVPEARPRPRGPGRRARRR